MFMPSKNEATALKKRKPLMDEDILRNAGFDPSRDMGKQINREAEIHPGSRDWTVSSDCAQVGSAAGCCCHITSPSPSKQSRQPSSYI